MALLFRRPVQKAGRAHVHAVGRSLECLCECGNLIQEPIHLTELTLNTEDLPLVTAEKAQAHFPGGGPRHSPLLSSALGQWYVVSEPDTGSPHKGQAGA